ncbi:FHA domain-containing protein [Candidatus Uabimicrobium amorphum]|uniref:Phosphopeptide-binding protein n=1 Tax=Uabimicrobium amorphum TaxID=2596890 RepID=A0A5S9F568_UABAM|nr:FHA domain-containing protein [Candidatus Uabimicrobium amorphum]BBM85234.1 phosphopeptide-binding protein [Candidatus Uabimicrobium amorphum]
MIVFRILSGGKEGKIIKSDLDVIYAGRKPECILQLDPYQDLSVHGQHAKIFKSSGHYYLEDLNSKNGTFVNEQPIKAPIQLKQGIVFRLGGDGPEIEVYDCKIEKEDDASSKIDNTFLLKRLDTDTVFNFDKTSVRLGRQPDCELALDPLKNREVSGYHALICCRDDGYYLEDLQSANGTFLNGVICKNSKLKNLDIVQLGKEGPKFQFLYQGSSSLETVTENDTVEVSNPVVAPEEQTPLPLDIVTEPVIEEEAETVIGKEEAPQAKTVKPVAKKKIRKTKQNVDFVAQVKDVSKKYLQQIRDNKNYKKIATYVRNHQKESIVIGVVCVVALVMLFSVFSRNVYDKTSLFETYNETIVPIYSRYLVRVNGKTIRGQMYSTGVLYNNNGKTNVIALHDSIFPWKKKSQDKVEELIHVIAIWPSHTPLFDKSLGYHTLDFTYSYNNDHTRIGGKKIGGVTVDKDGMTCKIVIDSIVPFSLPKKDVLINPQKNNEEEQVFSIYTSPENGIDGNGTLSKVVTMGKAKGPNLVISCKSQGAPIFNTYGEIIGVYLDSNLVPINY